MIRTNSVQNIHNPCSKMTFELLVRPFQNKTFPSFQTNCLSDSWAGWSKYTFIQTLVREKDLIKLCVYGASQGWSRTKLTSESSQVFNLLVTRTIWTEPKVTAKPKLIVIKGTRIDGVLHFSEKDGMSLWAFSQHVGRGRSFGLLNCSQFIIHMVCWSTGRDSTCPCHRSNRACPSTVSVLMSMLSDLSWVRQSYKITAEQYRLERTFFILSISWLYKLDMYRLIIISAKRMSI